MIVSTYFLLNVCQAAPFAVIVSFNRQIPPWGRYIIISPILQIIQLRLKKIIWLSQGHRSSIWWSQYLTPCPMAHTHNQSLDYFNYQDPQFQNWKKRQGWTCMDLAIQISTFSILGIHSWMLKSTGYSIRGGWNQKGCLVTFLGTLSAPEVIGGLSNTFNRDLWSGMVVPTPSHPLTHRGQWRAERKKQASCDGLVPTFPKRLPETVRLLVLVSSRWRWGYAIVDRMQPEN